MEFAVLIGFILIIALLFVYNGQVKSQLHRVESEIFSLGMQIRQLQDMLHSQKAQEQDKETPIVTLV